MYKLEHNHLAYHIERRKRGNKRIKFGLIERDKLVLWTILTFRWPGLAEYIEQNPKMISYIIGQKSVDGSSDVPKELWKLLSDEKVRDVVNGQGIGTSLDERAISELTISSYR